MTLYAANNSKIKAYGEERLNLNLGLKLKEVFERLRKFKLRINLNKCQFGKDKVDFLGYEINEHGIKPTQEKVNTIKSYPKPRTISDLRRFLGMVHFYRKSLPKAAHTHTQFFCL